MRRILMLVVLLATLAGAGLANATPTRAASGGNIVLTGHDMDYHCDGGGLGNLECQYLKIVLDKIRYGTTLPILVLDQGGPFGEAAVSVRSLYGTALTVQMDPTSALFATLPLVDGSGNPLYSAIVTASDQNCGGCDNNTAGEAAINARKADIATYFNDGGGILALAGADTPGYYDFVPVTATSVPVTYPFLPTALGTSFGVTSAMANCCATHNSFANPPAGSALQILETDGAGVPETLIALNAVIGGGGITGGGGGTDTPELGSGELLATGLLPILGIWLYRRRARRTTPASDAPAA